MNSYVPIHDKPNKTIAIARQIICLSLEGRRFLEAKAKNEIPNINIAARRANTRLARDGSKPMSVIKVSDMKNNSTNKYKNNIDVPMQSNL